ncbi:MAG: DUF4920 domain-containing protein, partial [Bacteroidia bacterium]
MKKILLPLLALALVYSCGNPETPKATAQYFGDSISADGAIPVAQVVSKMAGADSMPMKIEGKIQSVCQKKGCWMELDLGNEETIRVSFKDYAFFVPKDCSGKNVVLDGFARIDTTSVAELRHFAEDEGKSKDEIEKITTP